MPLLVKTRRVSDFAVILHEFFLLRDMIEFISYNVSRSMKSHDNILKYSTSSFAQKTKTCLKSYHLSARKFRCLK